MTADRPDPYSYTRNDLDFGGVIGQSATDSTPHYAVHDEKSSDSPNVLVILLDDVGFGQPAPFGGPVEMPALARLARQGTSFNRFHTTALCSPTRAALLSGRNQHLMGQGAIPEIATGFPGYNSLWPEDSSCIAEVLKENGYATAAFGKWHNTPEWEAGPTGPFDRWPTGRGFEYFYGFLGGDSSQWEPSLYENINPIDAPYTPAEGYHLDRDLSDRASAWVRKQRSVAPGKPFFLYYAPGTAHAPHHAPQTYIEKYRGRFDEGWDALRQQVYERQRAAGIVPDEAVLTPRPDQLPPWDSLSANERKVACRYMEVFAAALDHCDTQIDRLLSTIDDIGLLENTLVMYVAGDNGPSADAGLLGSFNKWEIVNSTDPDRPDLERIDEIGGLDSYNNYPAGWAWAGSTPYQWFKSIASHLGGTRNGMVVSWPRQIDAPAVASQWQHCVDIFPTILECAGIPVPAVVGGVPQSPLSGRSMASSFLRGSQADESPRIQYFEVFGNRAIYKDGWLCGARHGRLPWEYAGGSTGVFDADEWELYDLSTDFSQSHDVAADHPDIVAELRKSWHEQAVANDVYPLDDRLGDRMPAQHRPRPYVGEPPYIYYPGTRRVPEGMAPNLKGTSHTISAKVRIDVDTEGVIVAAGGRYAGYSMYVKKGRLVYAHNFCGQSIEIVRSDDPLPEGDHTLELRCVLDQEQPGAAATVTLVCDDVEVGSGRLTRTVPRRYSYTETFDIGEDSGSPVSRDEYHSPFRFTSAIERVVIDVGTPG